MNPPTWVAKGKLCSQTPAASHREQRASTRIEKHWDCAHQCIGKKAYYVLSTGFIHGWNELRRNAWVKTLCHNSHYTAPELLSDKISNWFFINLGGPLDVLWYWSLLMLALKVCVYAIVQRALEVVGCESRNSLLQTHFVSAAVLKLELTLTAQLAWNQPSSFPVPRHQGWAALALLWQRDYAAQLCSFKSFSWWQVFWLFFFSLKRKCFWSLLRFKRNVKKYIYKPKSCWKESCWQRSFSSFLHMLR